ncbi:MAG: hypothetical protein MUP13_16145 [Thermoanaerobaculales bacterium]|nr:hypothetical protein [Thermoanaerobaculales bacterium]
MRKTYTIDLALPVETVKGLAQQAGDKVAKWRRDGDLSWKYGSHVGLKAPGKAIVEIAPGEAGFSTLTIKLSRFGLVDLWGFLKNDYRDFYDCLEPLVRAETEKAGH